MAVRPDRVPGDAAGVHDRVRDLARGTEDRVLVTVIGPDRDPSARDLRRDDASLRPGVAALPESDTDRDRALDPDRDGRDHVREIERKSHQDESQDRDPEARDPSPSPGSDLGLDLRRDRQSLSTRRSLGIRTRREGARTSRRAMAGRAMIRSGIGIGIAIETGIGKETEIGIGRETGIVIAIARRAIEKRRDATRTRTDALRRILVLHELDLIIAMERRKTMIIEEFQQDVCGGQSLLSLM